MVDLRGKTCNITLTANNASSDTVKANIELYEACPTDADNQIISMPNLAIAPNTMMSKTVSAEYLPIDIDTIYLYAKADGVVTVNLKADCIEPPVLEYAYDTISSYDCIDMQKMWNDTVHVSETLDSIYTYIVNPFVAPAVMTDSLLATILGGTLPELTQGIIPVVEKAEIYTYYDATDTDAIADVVFVDWKADKVDCDALTHAMTLVVVDACGDTIYTTHNFPVMQRPAGEIDTVMICAEEAPYEWYGKNYEKTGLYFDTIQSVNGCDSILTLDLTVWPATKYETTNVTKCYGETYTWSVNGLTYDSSDVVTIVQRNILGCDSIVNVLNLNVLPEIPVTIIDTAICYGQVCVWNNQTYNISGEYTKTFTAVNGCDSVVTLKLTILPEATEKTTNVSLCSDSTYTWNVADTSFTYTRQGQYTYIVQNSYGCDSVIYTLNLMYVDSLSDVTKSVCHEELPVEWVVDGVTHYLDTTGIYTFDLINGCQQVLRLIVFPEITPTIFDTVICYGEYVDWEGDRYESTNYRPDTTISVTKTLTSMSGCDSVVTMNMKINAPFYREETVVACDSYEINGVTYTESDVLVFNHTAANGCDSIVTLHLTINKSEIHRDTVSECGEYIWHGTSYATSGKYEYITTTPDGCSRIDSLFLTINTPVVAEVYETACGEYTWNGQTYTTSGSYTQYFQTVAGCDSTVTLHLTIFDNLDVEENVLICAGESYTWNGMVYTASGDYIHSGYNANGCKIDSILHLVVVDGQTMDTTICGTEFKFTMNGIDTVLTTPGIHHINTGGNCDLTLNITFSQPSTADVYATACGEYTWNGQTYTTSGDYPYTTTASNGCDSIVTLHLTINTPVAADVYETACGKYTWNGQTYITSGDYPYTTTASNGCDSVVTLHLTIHQPDTVRMSEFACAPYIWNNEVYNTSGEYQQVLTNVNGCDSVVIKQLTLLPAVKDSIKHDTICHGQSIMWYNQLCATTGTYYATDTNQLGCDSMKYTLHLYVRGEIKGPRVDVPICYGDCYTIGGNEYCSEGIYKDTLPSQVGCDSIVTIHLIVLDSIAPKVDSAVICFGDSIEWRGKYYHTTGRYSDTVQMKSAPYCDSVFVFELTVLDEIPVQYYDRTMPYGGSYTWTEVNNKTYTTPGVYRDTLLTINGCDSIFELRLTMLPPVVVTKDTTITDFVCDGTVYVDPITGDKHIISSLIPSTQTWNDTVHVNPELDFVYIFQITPIVAPEKMTDAILTSIYGMIELQPGNTPIMDEQTIIDYYTRNDTEALSDVTKVTWVMTTVPCGATTHTMTLIVEDACDNILETTHTFAVVQSVVTITDTTICFGETLTWNEKPYSATGVYKDTLLNAYGCDSVYATLNLTIRPENKVVVDTAICYGTPFVWPEMMIALPNVTQDMTIDNNNIFTDINGCDSTVVVNIKVKYPTTSEENATACGEYTWNGQTYTTSGDYTYTTTGSNGCDSTVTLHLTITSPVTADVYETSCGEYTWNGQKYTTSGDYPYTTTGSNGCDSTVTLHLTINTPVTAEVYETSCGEYIWNGQKYTTSGDYPYTTTGSNGCDSTVTLHLTILPEAMIEAEELTLCPGDTIQWHGYTINAAGNYEATEKYMGVDCDSVIYQLTVTILDADNEATYDNLPAVSKYNNRILLLNLNEIKDLFGGWIPAEENVVWFRVVGTQDAAYAAWNKLGDDEPLAKGHYYNLPDGGTLPAGHYYALLMHPSETCEGGELLRTVILICEEEGTGPRLVPNVVRANETLTLENLNPSDVNEIRIYNSTGQLIETYTAEQVSKFIFNAAQVSGYYLVDVETENNKVTLRYVVK